MTDDAILQSAKVIKERGKLLIFTGAGISVESGIPSFRGQGGLWEKYDPQFIDIDYFYSHTAQSWKGIKEVFYDNWGEAKPNPAHYAVTELQKKGFADVIVTQNIDCLHQRAGAKNVVEFHGTLDRLVCTACSRTYPADKAILAPEIPFCPACRHTLKPDFVFFGEGIPESASERAFASADEASCVLVVGTTGEVTPACYVPREAKRRGAVIIEVNPGASAFTNTITDIYVSGMAGDVLPRIVDAIAKL